MNKKLLATYGLKWNPFAPEVPVEALLATPPVENFCWRVENLAREGGFALVTGEVGVGKSFALRLLCGRLSNQRDVVVGVLARPQAGLADFYREMGDLFGVALTPHNRWAGSKVLRERWQAHIEAALFRAVLVIDEAQEMPAAVLNELRLLCASQLDSRSLLTVVLAGDRRLTDRLATPDLLPLGSRIRVRLAVESRSPEELQAVLRHALAKAGNPKLMTPEAIATLCEHAAGNLRVLMGMAAELLDAGLQRDARQLDEKLYLETFAVPSPPERKAASASGRRR
jgi:type II secretory pathway predicted ATPase ExeA